MYFGISAERHRDLAAVAYAQNEQLRLKREAKAAAEDPDKTIPSRQTLLRREELQQAQTPKQDSK